MARQFVTAKFRKDDRRTYTYHNDGDPLASGDGVKVMDRFGEGWKRVWIVDAGVPEPDFPTKPILGPAPPEEDAEASF